MTPNKLTESSWIVRVLSAYINCQLCNIWLEARCLDLPQKQRISAGSLVANLAFFQLFCRFSTFTACLTQSPSPFTKIPFDLDYFWYCLILRCCLRKSTIVLMRFCSLSALVHGFLPYAGLYIGLENIFLAHCVSVLWRTCACIVTVVCYCNEGLSRIMFLTD